MNLDELDALIRVAAITTLLLLAWLLLRNPRQIGLPSFLFAPMALCLSCFVITNTPAQVLRLTGLSGRLAHDASGFTVIFLWWFCLSCFDRRFRPRGGILAVGLIWGVIAAFDRGLFGQAFADKGLSRFLVALGFGIVGHLVWSLTAERSGDLIERRHDARIAVAAVLGGMLFIDLAADTLFGFAWRPMGFAMSQNIMILGFGLWLAGKALAVRPDILTFDAGAIPLRLVNQPADKVHRDDGLRRRLIMLIDQERIFLDPELTLAKFVERMGAPERTVRKLINHDLGHDHFRTFLNHYRLAEARRLLQDPGHDGEKLIAIALDSGFASLASFNRIFRAGEGCSPSQYRAAARKHASQTIDQPDLGSVVGF
jgi:AraC-like DNA-binding protein